MIGDGTNCCGSNTIPPCVNLATSLKQKELTYAEAGKVCGLNDLVYRCPDFNLGYCRSGECYIPLLSKLGAPINETFTTGAPGVNHPTDKTNLRFDEVPLPNDMHSGRNGKVFDPVMTIAVALRSSGSRSLSAKVVE